MILCELRLQPTPALAVARDHDLALDVDAEPPDLPGLHAWRSVYLFVFGWFVLVVILLAVFARIFS